MKRWPIESKIFELLKQYNADLSNYLEADILYYYGPIYEPFVPYFLDHIEEIPDKKKKLYILLTTNGGSAAAVERYVNIIRYHYQEVNFVVPNYAYSAGTIFCMSGDDIFMDYSSVLGPIDPQVQNKDGKWVAALGYLDKVNELIEKAKANELTPEEFVILKDMDLGELRGYEQARDLTIDLLKQWLVQYKFKNWFNHETSEDLIGTPVTEEQKVERAQSIADALSDNNHWKSHGRGINIKRLKDELRLKIHDYSREEELRKQIRNYHNLITDYVEKDNLPIFVHSGNIV